MVLQEGTGFHNVSYCSIDALNETLCPISHRKKREAKIKRDVKRGIREPNDQNPFEIFVTVTDIRYTYVVRLISCLYSSSQLLQGIS